MSSANAAESMVEYALEDALSRGQGWICLPDKLARLRTMLTPQRQIEVDNRLKEWQRAPFNLSMAWIGSGGFRYVAGPYMGDSIDALVRKLQQFPSGTHFVCALSPEMQARHRAEVDAVKAAAQSAGLVLEFRSAGL